MADNHGYSSRYLETLLLIESAILVMVVVVVIEMKMVMVRCTRGDAGDAPPPTFTFFKATQKLPPLQ